MYIFRVLVTLNLLLYFVNLKAQFQAGGQIRARYEFRDGYKTLKRDEVKDLNYISQRSRIWFTYQKEGLEFKISFQDVHEWGSIEQKKMKEGNIGIQEGWVKFNFPNKLFIQIGRQGIQYDNGRLMAYANWNQVGLTHDALRLGFENNDWQLETALAYNHSDGFVGSPYKLLNSIWLNKKIGKFSFSLLNLADVRQKNDTTFVDYLRNTVGPIFKFKSEKVDVAFRSFYQFGKEQSGMNVSAYYVNAEAGYNVTTNISTIFGFDVKSGNDANNTSSTVDNAIDFEYGSQHKFNGLMDYFRAPSDTKGSGLVDIYAKLGFSPGKKLSLEVQLHHFNLQNNYLENNVILDPYLGKEIDLTAKYKFNKTVELYFSYSTLFGTESLEVIKGGDKDLFNSFAVVMLTVRPIIFKQESSK